MTQTILAFVAAILLLVTDPAMAATVDTNQRAIARLEQRAAQRGQYVATRLAKPVPSGKQRVAPSTLAETAAQAAWRERYMQERPYWLVQWKQRGAKRVRGGYLIHRSKARGEGFFQPLTADEANKR